MTKKLNFETGRLGESLASKFLADRGYQILQRNFRTRFGEIDLVAAKDGILVFVEVKLKVGDNFGTPEEVIGPAKIKQIEKTAQNFLTAKPEYRDRYSSYRIDAVCIVLDETKQVERISHYANISF